MRWVFGKTAAGQIPAGQAKDFLQGAKKVEAPAAGEGVFPMLRRGKTAEERNTAGKGNFLPESGWKHWNFFEKSRNERVARVVFRAERELLKKRFQKL